MGLSDVRFRLAFAFHLPGFSQFDRFSKVPFCILLAYVAHTHTFSVAGLFLILCEFFVLLMCDCVYAETVHDKWFGYR